MKDKGTVIENNGPFALVRVECLSACEECSAHLLCIGNKKNSGLVSVKNTLEARPGDCVEIEVPESGYARSLSTIFGGLLAAILFGAGGGYAAAAVFSLPVETTAAAGSLLALAAAGFIINRLFRQKNLKSLYPRIIAINEKGDCNG